MSQFASQFVAVASNQLISLRPSWRRSVCGGPPHTPHALPRALWRPAGASRREETRPAGGRHTWAPGGCRQPIGHAVLASRGRNWSVTAVSIAGVFLLRVPPQHEVPLRSRGAGGSPNRVRGIQNVQLNIVTGGRRRARWNALKGIARSEGGPGVWSRRRCTCRAAVAGSVL
jgi:hypothetical protein